MGNSYRLGGIEVVSALRKKELDKITGTLLYKNARAMLREGEDQMLTTWTYTEHSAKRQPCVGMRGVCLSGSLSLSFVTLGINTFGGRLGQTTSIDSRHIRQ